ncbi:hypothetical protein C8F01DRAFT_1118253 [Mycena amicta]|nr:hypothetical protein C8F01DRAFT_1118253 [Mycena amicta]
MKVEGNRQGPHVLFDGMDLDSLSGVDLYNARRARWLTPPSPSEPRPADSDSLSLSRRRLEQVLNGPLTDEVWFGNIQKIWKGLAVGGRLKKRLPMRLVVKLVHAAWIRDNTWPAGAIVPEDDELDPPPAPILMPTSAPSSGISTPWTPVEEG